MTAVLRHVPPVPPEFAARFVSGGWREVERIYGARTDLLLKWIAMSGGEDLHRLRREHLRTNGVHSPHAGGNRIRPKGVDTASWLDR